MLAYIETRPRIAGVSLKPVDLVVQRVDGLYRLALPDRGPVEGAAPYLLGTMLHAVFASFIEEVPGAPLIHAASVCIDGVPILLVGATGSGKTTLALYLMERGYSVQGDEHVAVREADLITRPRTLRVKASSWRFTPGLARRIQRAPSIADCDASLIYAVSPAICGKPWRIAAMCAPCLVFLEPNHGGHTVAKPVSVDDAFSRLLARSLLPDAKAPAVARLRRVARDAQAWEMSLGDLEEAERHLTAIAAATTNNH